MLLDRFYTTAGEMTPEGRSLMKRKGRLTEGEQILKDEIIVLQWSMFEGMSAREKAVAKKLGLTEKVVKACLERNQAHLMLSEGGPAAILANHVRLAEVRFQGRKKLIEELMDLSLRALTVVNVKLETATPGQAMLIAAQSVDKALLLQGQANNIVKRQDERFHSDEELEAKKAASGAKLSAIEASKQRLKLVGGGENDETIDGDQQR